MSEPVRRRPTLADEVTTDLLGMLREEGMTPGARLPSTGALAKQFGVATPTVREVLRRLEATGVVSIRHGSGVYVRESAPRLVIANPSRAVVRASSVIEVLEARLLIEPPLAELAARRRTDDDLARLDGILADAAAAIEAGDDLRLCAATMSFHATIAATAGNAVLAESVRAIGELYGDHQVRIGRLFDDRELDQREHHELLAAVRAGQPRKARRLMTDHLTEVRDVVAARLTAGEGEGQ